MRLCTHRPEGFGPSSHLSSPLPTTCFIDTILIPLPIWLALALLVLFSVLTILNSRRTQDVAFNSSSTSRDPVLEPLRVRRSKRLLFITIIYYLLLIAQLLMITLEIVRLALAHLGLGLIPFAYPGILLAAVLHFLSSFHRSRRHLKYWQAINLVIFLGGLCMSAISAAALAMQPKDVRDRRNKGMGDAGKYPVADEITDVAVMAGVYGVLAILEVGLWWVERRSNRVASREAGMKVEG